ncbi:hypothetical protein [Lentzea sp. HUAS12]|uniref:hypothetical protein n=1 Tax=Lentzea sp. HUAS12 TaxID=2951806 RepID=UPI00209E0223|nr:hypothetical protein [Lentzea sp. HUAS12]USX53702.1 hypothetical protein ND450_06255 [Lentzea sp. HUAS12]
MTRKKTAALVLAAIPAVLTMTFLPGTAQADDSRWGKGHRCDTHATRIAADGDTPWGSVTSDDTPWGRKHPVPVHPIDGRTSRCDTPWG